MHLKIILFLKDPDGRDAAGKIKGNTITISAHIFIFRSGASKEKAAEMQNQIMKTWGGKMGWVLLPKIGMAKHMHMKQVTF